VHQILAVFFIFRLMGMFISTNDTKCAIWKKVFV
jgi:hypothetical protein